MGKREPQMTSSLYNNDSPAASSFIVLSRDIVEWLTA
jgi:hypothetical protein